MAVQRARRARSFREVTLHDGTRPDPRVADAIDMVREARQPDGTWLQGDVHGGAVWVETDVRPAARSKGLTLIGTRVLDWWDAAQ